METGIYVDNYSRYIEPGLVSFTYISQYVSLLEDRKNRLDRMRISFHADILNERHIVGNLAKIVPMQQLMDADLFLFLRSEFQDNKEAAWHNWIPWTKLYMRQVPRYLVEASSLKYAQKLLPSLGLEDIDTFRINLKSASEKLAKMFSNGWPSSPLSNLNPLTVGSKP